MAQQEVKMKRREFLLATFAAPLLLLPKQKVTTPMVTMIGGGGGGGSGTYTYPKMDIFVNDNKVLPDKIGPFWLHPCSHLKCTSPRDYWLHNG